MMWLILSVIMTTTESLMNHTRLHGTFFAQEEFRNASSSTQSPEPLDSFTDGATESFFWINNSGNASSLSPFTISVSATTIGTVISYVILIFICIVGNLLVIGAFFKEPALQAITNYWIVSLSLTDIVLAATVMPLQVKREFVSGAWMLGPIACDLFISLDVLCCSCSIYHLALISTDRYFCVRFPIRYPAMRTTNKTVVAILLTWLWCTVISMLRLFGWKDTPQTGDEYSCEMSNKAYMIISSLLSFYFPLALCIFMYIGIYKATRERTRRFNRELAASTRVRNYLHTTTQRLPETARTSVSPAAVARGRQQPPSDADSTLAQEYSLITDNKNSDESTLTGTAELQEVFLSSSLTDVGGGGGASEQAPVNNNSKHANSSIRYARRRRATDVQKSDVQTVRMNHTNASQKGTTTVILDTVRVRLRASLHRRSQTLQNLHPSQSIGTPCATAMERKRVNTTSEPSISLTKLTPLSEGARPAGIVSAGQSPFRFAREAPPLSGSDLQRRKDKLARLRLDRKRQKQEHRAIRVVLIVLGAFVVFWAPFFLVNIIAPLCDEACPVTPEVWKWVTWLGYVNSAVNPFIYTFFNRTFRRAIFSILRCERKRRR